MSQTLFPVNWKGFRSWLWWCSHVKTMKMSWYFSPVCHCGTPYSKSRIACTRPNTALWRPAVRQLWSDGFRRLMNRFGRASSMLWLWWFTNRLPIFAWNFAFPADFWCRGYPLQNISCVTKRKQKVAAFLRRLIWWAGFILNHTPLTLGRALALWRSVGR